jgi:phage gp36-like protein
LSYITETDLVEELGEAKLIQLTDNNRSGQIDHGRVGKAISYAIGTFDSYARTRYTLPVPVTEKVRATCLDLAIYHLYKSRATTNDGVYEVRRDTHNAAIKFLEALQSGKAALDIPATEETAINPGTPDRVLKGASKPIFTDDRLNTY